MTTTATAPESKEAGRLGLSPYLGYAGGDVANNLTFSLASMFLLLYYTDVAGIIAGAAGTPLLVVRVWQAFTDILGIGVGGYVAGAATQSSRAIDTIR
jgi:glucuronide carrier protein